MARAVAAWPDDPKARAWLARLLRSAGRKEEAIDAARKVLDVAPDNAVALSALGITLLDLGRAEEALATFERAVGVAPREPDLWLGKGMAEQRLRKLPEAIASFERGLEIDSGGGLLRRQLAVTLSVSGRMEEALAQARRVTELAPHSSGAWGVLARVLINSGDQQGGIDALVEALRYPPVEPWVQNLASKYGLPKSSS
jgi:Flp pilus assembly protein TadD